MAEGEILLVFMSSIESSLLHALLKRKENNSFRSLSTGLGLIDFSSNDYLGLSRNLELANAIERSFSENETSHKLGATGSRLITGNSVEIERLESFLAQIHRSESTLVFNSGYTACFGVLSTIPQKGDTILYDELSHACIKDGARLSVADQFSFRHNDLEDLERKILRSKGNCFVVIESVYSMDGDFAPLKEICRLAKKNKAEVIIDEAHSTGVFGLNGSGLVCELGLEKEVFIRIHTFGKAMGVHGACVASSQIVKDYLINFCRPFIYTTALSLHAVLSIEKAYKFLVANPYLQTNLRDKISLFKNKVNPILLQILSDSSIQAILISGNSVVKDAAKSLQSIGFDVRPILSPTVALGKERLRISLHAHNSEEEIISLANALNQLF